ncbi:ATP-binding protein [Ideonella dechloratans]|uniref:ATP-binding protein n=1 Tax=Ideonella dechloratans TaxID=36863 RepID=A0A643FB84_IDEDE|nr:ATP-binding protein [Ideonella dechloratans]KAB0576292.1 ATP-binding protein [Ideonella dechloratans]UFU10144.1 ATP-binding protein [Ideonella dechloratans]
MSSKHWVAQAAAVLQESLQPVPHELNELDWKSSLSTHKDRLAEHLMALANLAGGGTLVFRVSNSGQVQGIAQDEAERIEACDQHAVLQSPSSQTLTNTSLRQRFQLHDKQRNSITNLIADAVAAGRIKRKDTSSGNKFAEYIPYWA